MVQERVAFSETVKFRAPEGFSNAPPAPRLATTQRRPSMSVVCLLSI